MGDRQTARGFQGGTQGLGRDGGCNEGREVEWGKPWGVEGMGGLSGTLRGWGRGGLAWC